MRNSKSDSGKDTRRAQPPAERELTALQQGWHRQQAVETHFMPKQRSLQISTATRASPVLTGSVDYSRWRQNIKTRFDCTEDWAEISHGVMERVWDYVTRRDSNLTYAIIIYMASGKSPNLSGTAFLPQKGIMPSVLPISQDCHNSGIRPYLCEYCVNHNLQTDSICRVYRGMMFIKNIFNCFKILKDEWGKLLLYENTNK